MNTFFVMTTILAGQTFATTDSQTFKETDLKNDSTLTTKSAAMEENLDELVVVAKKEVVKSTGEQLSYDMTQDESSKGLTLLEAIKKVPMITVDANDKIQINGNSNFKIYVNGKEEPMLQANYDKIFKAMPANSVQKIEVITEPGAKYDAEGTGGILNLITETTQRKDGYSGSLGASLSNRDYFFTALGRIKYNHFSADANITYGENAFTEDGNSQLITTFDKDSDINYRQEQRMDQSFRYNFTNASINASWEPNEGNLFTFGGSVMALDAKVGSLSSSTSMWTKNNQLLWEYSQNITGGLKTFSTSATAAYQHNFGDKRHYLVASWLFNFGRNPMDLLSESPYGSESDITNLFSKNYTINYTREHTLQLDYSNPFGGETHKLETGAKAILRHNSAFGQSGEGATPNTIVLNPSNESNLNQLQDIYALYASYTGTFGNISTKAGVRYEHTRMGIRNKIYSDQDFTRHLNDIVPNAAITYMFGPAINLRLGYQMRITRPSIQQMNPFQMNILGTMVQEGNPDLESEKSNKISLTYTNFGSIMGGNVYLDYTHINNGLEEYEYVTIGENGSIIGHSTTANIGHSYEIGLGGFYNLNVNSKMNISVNGRVAYVSMMAPSPYLKNHGWTGNYGANWNYTGPVGIKFSAYGGHTINRIRLQGSFSGWYYYGIGISRGFINDALNLSLSASNFLQDRITFKSNTTVGSQHISSSNTQKTWKVGVNLTWNFGHLKSAPKKTETSIDNDDISTSSGGGIGI